MPRIEPDHNNASEWEAHYQAGDWPWDKGSAHPEIGHRGILWGSKPLRVLAPGCGRGHDVRGWAAAGHRVTGLDLSPGAVRHAQEAPRAGTEDYLVGDLFDPPSDWLGHFDLVWEHTCYCAIHPEQRPAYAETVRQLLKPGGRLAGVFFCHPEKPLEEGPPFSSRPDDVKAVLGTALALVDFAPAQAEFEGREGVEWFGVWQREG